MIDLQAEQAVLGAVLLNPQWIDHANLTPAHFYDPTHGALWEEMQQRYRDGRLIDGVALRGFAAETFKDIGGVGYLVKLMDASAAMSAQVTGYGEIIRAHARNRAVTAACNETIALAKQGGETLTQLEQRLQEIASTDADADAWERLGAVAMEAVERAELGEAVGLSTGLKKLDEVTGGMQPGTLWVVGGATSMGKSVFGAHLGRAVASQGYGVGEIHLEMRKLQIGLRTSAALATSVTRRPQPFPNVSQVGSACKNSKRFAWYLDTISSAGMAATAFSVPGPITPSSSAPTTCCKNLTARPGPLLMPQSNTQ